MKKICILLAILILVILFAGCAGNDASPVTAETEITEAGAPSPAFPEDQRLRLTVGYAKESGCIRPDPDSPGELYYGADSINYQNLTDIRIEIDGETMLLQEAMEQDLVTTDELEAWARVDAKRGYCNMAYGSTNGFAQYAYKYHDFVLQSRYDIYEAPNGMLYHDQILTLSNPANYISVTEKNISRPHPRPEAVSENNPWGLLDVEDWGVKFEVLSASPTQLTLRCTQSGGQHVGQLKMENGYAVSQLDNRGAYTDVSYEHESFRLPAIDVTIENEGVTEFTIVWPESWGELPIGEYEFTFQLKDTYEEMPPLMRNYEDFQTYTVAFTV